jgi:hypothetical protein
MGYFTGSLEIQDVNIFAIVRARVVVFGIDLRASALRAARRRTIARVSSVDARAISRCWRLRPGDVEPYASAMLYGTEEEARRSWSRSRLCPSAPPRPNLESTHRAAQPLDIPVAFRSSCAPRCLRARGISIAASDSLPPSVT